jgi:hypothetical protein
VASLFFMEKKMPRTLMSAAPTDRVGRYPKHTFHTKELPFTAQPFLLARVLPGETLQNLKIESRVITDPIKNGIIGWRKEYFFFYVRVTDLMVDAIKDMFVDPTNADITGLDAANNSTEMYTAKGAIPWTDLCLTRIIDSYFRDEGESRADYQTVEGVPIVQIRQNNFMDSLTDKDDIPEGDAISTATDAGDLDRLMDAFEMARAMGMADMSYEDFLRMYGIAIPNKDENKPELIASFADWQYPTNHVEPTTGAPSSAVSWVFNNSMRKPKMFKEPGFIVGVSVTRPKVYFRALAGSAAGFAKRAWDWSPAYLTQMPETTLRQFAPGTGPLGDTATDTDHYWLDMRDELIYGDQFQNVADFPDDTSEPVNNGDFNLLNLPGNDLGWKYPAAAMVKTLFTDTVNNTSVRQDGYVGLSIKGSAAAPIVDYTMGNIAEQ